MYTYILMYILSENMKGFLDLPQTTTSRNNNTTYDTTYDTIYGNTRTYIHIHTHTNTYIIVVNTVKAFCPMPKQTYIHT